MKIYANNYTKEDLEYYIGKDIWVKCNCASGHSYYMRILSKGTSKYGTPIIVFNKIKAYIVENFRPTMKLLSTLLNEQHRGMINDYAVCEPVETLTTDEIIDIFERKNEQ